MPTVGTPSTPTGAAGSPAKPAGAPTAGTPGTGTTTTGTKPAGTAGSPGATTTAGTTPATGGAAGAAGSAPTASGASGSAAAAGSGGKSSASGTAGAAGSAQPDTGSTATGDGPLTGESKCLADITTYDKAGPVMVKMEREGMVNFWVPSVPEGCKVPIIHLANGTGASCSSYGEALQRFATHGFLTCCYEDANTGAGTQGLEAFKTAMTKYPNLAAKAYGSTGHSQGGQASFVVQALAEKEFGLDGNKFAGLAMEPASGFGSQPAGSWQMQYASIKSPMFMFAGQGTDGLVSEGWVMDAYNAMDKGTEVYFWARQGATHIPVPNGEEMQIGPAWFRWKLLDDQAACKYFKAIPMTDTTWKEDASMNVKDCK
jgi:hypothetical protein